MGRLDDAFESYRRFLATPGNYLPDARIKILAKIRAIPQRKKL